MNHESFRPLRDRAFRFALDATNFCRGLPATWEGVRLRDQLFRAATSVAANYRAAARGRSPNEFIAKIGLVVEEADESEFWLAFIKASEVQISKEGERLLRESEELLAIFAASLSTAKANQRRKKAKRKNRGKAGTPPDDPR